MERNKFGGYRNDDPDGSRGNAYREMGFDNQSWFCKLIGEGKKKRPVSGQSIMYRNKKQ